MSAPRVSGEVSRVSMRASMPTPVLPFKRHQSGSPYELLAQALGYAKAKTARDTVSRPYRQVAITNRVLIQAGRAEKALELMAEVDASLLTDVPPFEECLHLHNKADAVEDVAEADFLRGRGDAELREWVRKLAAEGNAITTMLAACVGELARRESER